MSDNRSDHVREAGAPYATSLPRLAEEAPNLRPHEGLSHEGRVFSGVRSGYKQTEVGVIPEDWEAKQIGSEIDLLTGHPFPSSGYVEFGVRLLRGSNVKRGETDWRDDITQFWPSISSDVARYELRPFDLVIAMDGSLVGRSYARLSRDDLPALLLQRVARIRSAKLDVGYLTAFVGSDRFIKYVDSVKTVTAIPHISPGDIRKFCIPVPPTIAEQRAIAAALSDVDALLDGLERLIAKKRDLKQAAMQQLLTGQTRLPGFSGEWDRGVLGDVIETLEAGVSVNSIDGDPSPGTRCILKTSALSEGNFIPQEAKCIAPQDLSRAKINPRRDSILISRMNTPELVGEIAYVGSDYPWLYLPDRLWMTRFRTASDIVARWLAYLLSSSSYKNLLKGISTGTSGSMKNISKEALLALEIRFPNASEQMAIAAVLSDMDAELSALEARRDKTRALKQAMMQELLTGRTRLVMPSTDSVEERAAEKGTRQANVYFMRSVLAAEIVDRLHEEPTFGHVKFEKILFLVEHLGNIDTGSTYHRKAAGPYDNRALRSIDSQLRKQQWFDARNQDGRYRYVPMTQRGHHKQYFERYFSEIGDVFEKVINTFRKLDTERCEIVATLFSAWNDLLRKGECPSDDVIVNEILNNWHESKRRIPEERWLKALVWMRNEGIVPTGS